MINICFKSNCISSRAQINEIDRASKRNFARRNKTVLGRRGQAETSFKVEDCAAECPDNVYFIQSSDKHNSDV